MKYKFILISVLLLTVISGCRENIVEFSREQSTGEIYVNSSPANADIYLNNRSTGKSTPAKLKYLEPGSYSVLLKLDGYRDSSVSVTVEAEDEESLFILLNRN